MEHKKPYGTSPQIDAYPLSAFVLIYDAFEQSRSFEPRITVRLKWECHFLRLFLETLDQMLEGVSKYLKIPVHRNKGRALA